MQYPRNATAAVPIPATIAVLEISFMVKIVLEKLIMKKMCPHTSQCDYVKFLEMTIMGDCRCV